MKDTIFREYDIRGKVGTELFIDEVYNLTLAIAYYFKQQAPHLKTVAVGMDGRIHSAALYQEIQKALVDSGINILFLGICTSPAVYFATHTLPVDGGLMITASHNTKEYNGIKMCLGTRSVWGQEIKAIHTTYRNKKRIVASSTGTITNHPIVEPYTTWLANHFSHLQGIALSAVIDCGNGAAGAVMPTLIQKMNWPHVQLLYAEVDGTYPHHEADPTVEENMKAVKQILATTPTSIGMGLDGDGDRMAAMTKNGFLVPGDQLLALFAHTVLKQHPGTSIVFDIKSSGGLSEAVSTMGGVPIMSPSGHALIKENMHKNSAQLGGELSCHFCFKDRYFGYDDGIYALLRLCELLHESGKTIEQLLSLFPQKYSSREFRIFCEDIKKQSIIDRLYTDFSCQKEVKIITIDGIRASTSYGWGIVRPSNTQPALSIRFEGNTPENLQRIKNDFIHALQPHMPELNLADIFNE